MMMQNIPSLFFVTCLYGKNNLKTCSKFHFISLLKINFEVQLIKILNYLKTSLRSATQLYNGVAIPDQKLCGNSIFSKL